MKYRIKKKMVRKYRVEESKQEQEQSKSKFNKQAGKHDPLYAPLNKSKLHLHIDHAIVFPVVEFLDAECAGNGTSADPSNAFH
jgi:hypothetical protein